MSTKLKKCPFCGMDVAEIYSQSERAEEDGEVFNGVEQYTIVCDVHKKGCGATCGWRTQLTDAINRWNTRVVI